MATDKAAAWFAPDAPPGPLAFINNIIVWTLAWDDYFTMQYKQRRDRHGARRFTDRLHALLDNEGLGAEIHPGNPVEKGLIDVLRQMQSVTPTVRRRYREAIGGYIEGGMWELDNMCNNRIPDLIEYVELRRETFFSYGILNYIDTATDVEIPERIRPTRTITALLNAIMDHWALENDIVSYHREINSEGERSNIVLILQRLHRIDAPDAITTVTTILRQRLALIEHIINTQVPHLADHAHLTTNERTSLMTWIRGARNGLTGTHAWHTYAPRYRDDSAHR